MNIFIQLCHFKRFYKKICSFRFNFNPFFKACHFLYWVSNDKLPNQVNSKFFDLFILQKKSWWENFDIVARQQTLLYLKWTCFEAENHYWTISIKCLKANVFLTGLFILIVLWDCWQIFWWFVCLVVKGLLINHLIIDGMFSCLYIKELLISLIKWTLQFLQVKRLI